MVAARHGQTVDLKLGAGLEWTRSSEAGSARNVRQGPCRGGSCWHWELARGTRKATSEHASSYVIEQSWKMNVVWHVKDAGWKMVLPDCNGRLDTMTSYCRAGKREGTSPEG